MNPNKYWGKPGLKKPSPNKKYSPYEEHRGQRRIQQVNKEKEFFNSKSIEYEMVDEEEGREPLLTMLEMRHPELLEAFSKILKVLCPIKAQEDH